MCRQMMEIAGNSNLRFLYEEFLQKPGQLWEYYLIQKALVYWSQFHAENISKRSRYVYP